MNSVCLYMRLKTSMFCALFVLINLSAAAQHVLLVHAITDEDQKALAEFSYKKDLQDSLAAKQQVNSLINALWERGYLMAGAKEIHQSSDTSEVKLTIGRKFHWASLSADSVNENWLNKTIWRKKLYQDKPFRYGQVARLMLQLVEEAENDGYPFASVKLDSVKMEDAQLRAHVQMEQGPYIIFDTLVIEGNARLSPKFLAAHLGIRYGEPYSQQKVQNAATLLRNLPYIRLLQEPKISFQNRQATILLELENKKSNVIDGIIGFLPDPQENGRLMFTGQFDLQLQNPFGTGKKLELHWQRLNSNSQNLEAAYYHPYVLGSLISAEGNFRLLKEEENFVNRELNLELQLQQGAHNTVRIISRQKDSRLLAVRQDANLASFTLGQFGLGFTRQKLDDPVQPQRGYHFTMDFTGGRKKVRSAVLNADTTQVALTDPGMQYRGTALLRYFWPMGPHWVWAHSLEAGLLKDDRLYINDMHRLGGLSTLRGFREKSFFVSDYVLSRLELRYLASRDTYLFMFYDQSWMEQKSEILHATDWPLGLGGGLSLGTSSGTFNLVYGIGKSENQPLSFVHSQVHFGYVNRF